MRLVGTSLARFAWCPTESGFGLCYFCEPLSDLRRAVTPTCVFEKVPFNSR